MITIKRVWIYLEL